jgi:hypothetical protein
MPVRYRTAADAEAERLAADRLGELMQCEVHAFPPLTPIDWYACRHDALVAYLEVKTRSHRHDAFGTVYLSVRKWLALELAELAQGVPSAGYARVASTRTPLPSPATAAQPSTAATV